MKLISATDYSDYLQVSIYSDSEKWELFRLFVKFIKQQLAIWMFVPCKFVDGVWVVLEEPLRPYGEYCTNNPPFRKDFEDYFILLKEYQEAKDRVLFEGCGIVETNHFKTCEKAISTEKSTIAFKRKLAFGDDWFFVYDMKTIEDLVKYNLELTPTAQKQIGCV